MKSVTVLDTGTYQHYKGRLYEVIGVGKDTETEEAVVIYRPLYDSDIAYWVRPYAMFCDDVVVDRVVMPRFTKIDDNRR